MDAIMLPAAGKTLTIQHNLHNLLQIYILFINNFVLHRSFDKYTKLPVTVL